MATCYVRTTVYVKYDLALSGTTDYVRQNISRIIIVCQPVKQILESNLESRIAIAINLYVDCT